MKIFYILLRLNYFLDIKFFYFFNWFKAYFIWICFNFFFDICFFISFYLIVFLFFLNDSFIFYILILSKKNKLKNKILFTLDLKFFLFRFHHHILHHSNPHYLVIFKYLIMVRLFYRFIIFEFTIINFQLLFILFRFIF